MPKGKIGGFHGNVGQVLSEGNIYNFNISNVQGSISNQQEIEFELDNEGNVKVIFGAGIEKKKVEKVVAVEKTAKMEKKTFLTEEK